MSQIKDLALRYLHRKLGSALATPSTLTASAGTVRTAVCAALTEIDDYWNGAIVRWITGANAGRYSSVLDFTASSDTLTFDEDLPNAVVNTDTFMLLHGGKYMSDQEIPPFTATAPIQVTGFSITRAAHVNGEGTGVLHFYYHGGSGQTCSWTPPGGTEGAEVSVGALATNDPVTLYAGGSDNESKSKFITLKRTAAALPTANKQDDIALTAPLGTFLAPFSGTETTNGVTIYRAVGLLNLAAATIYAVKAFCPTPFTAASNTTIAAGGAIGTDADELVASDLTGWGAHGWIFNSTKNDVRYYYNRSGNTVQVIDPGAGQRGKTADDWDVGDTLKPYPWFDIGLDAPAANVFEDPATDATAPTGVTFSCPLDEASALLIGDLATTAEYVVWQRWVIPAGFQPLDAGRGLLRIYAEVSEA